MSPSSSDGTRRWRLNEDAGRIGISGPALAHHESVPVIEELVTDEMVTAALSAYHYFTAQGAYEPDDAMRAALEAAFR